MQTSICCGPVHTSVTRLGYSFQEGFCVAPSPSCQVLLWYVQVTTQVSKDAGVKASAGDESRSPADLEFHGCPHSMRHLQLGPTSTARLYNDYVYSVLRKTIGKHQE